ncbi:MAG TPA: DUF4173 domain-containing protein [Micromonosporaceae bacterium]|nr:DUF4173 domain-containing protein [Micromonosporaceae bacterium]
MAAEPPAAPPTGDAGGGSTSPPTGAAAGAVAAPPRPAGTAGPGSTPPPLPGPPRPPLPPGWLTRNWPALVGHAPRPAVFGVVVTALVAAVVLVLSRPGLGWLAVTLVLAGTALAIRRGSGRRPEPRARRAERAGWAVAAVLLVAVGTFRDDGYLFLWCVLAALACGSVALIGGRTSPALAVGALAMPLAVFRALPWWSRGARRASRSGTGIRIGRTVAVSAVLVVVFGVLFITADPEFARLLNNAAPTVDGGEVGRAVVALILCGLLAIGGAYLAAGRPVLDDVPPVPGRAVRRAEWVAPLAVLNLLFLAFVLVQLETLFGGKALVLRTTGLTYARYARSGFWQLLIVAGLTLIVIAVAARFAPRDTPTDRTLLRLLLGGLAGLTLVIVASALQRIGAYSDAYGLTRERLVVWVAEAWLGLVFVMVVLAGIPLRAGWLPRAGAATAVLALLATAAVGPDRFIAQQNVERYFRIGRIDVSYLSRLSADALPELLKLPPGRRECAVAAIERGLAYTDDDWRSWNLSRTLARSVSGNPYVDLSNCDIG